MIKKALLTTLGVALTSSLLMSTAQAGEVLDKVKAKGFVQCGVSQGLPGFSNTDVMVSGLVSTSTFVAA